MPHRFVVISDTHFFEPSAAPDGDKTWWNRVLQTRAAEIGASLVETINALEPEFLIHCGDFTGHCDMGNFDFGCRIMDRLKCPWYMVPGNHDTWFPGVRGAIASRYGLRGEQCHYSRELAGLHFIFLDVAHWASREGLVSPYLDKELYDRGDILGMGPDPDGLSWLEAELAHSGDRPVVLVSHAPLGFKEDYPAATLPYGEPVRSPRTSLAAYMGDIMMRKPMRDVMRRHPQVKVAFAGHWHICDVACEDGVVFCQTGALREYPFEFRLVSVDSGRMTVTTLGLNDDRFQRMSYIEEWGNRWVAGTGEDREFAVVLG